HGLRAPVAARAPVANNSESPGRNGVTTRPVSANTIANRIAYTQGPYAPTSSRRGLSKCSRKSNIRNQVRLDLVEGLGEGGAQVVRVLYARGNANEAVRNAQRHPAVRRHRGVGHRSGM